jgi:hypothetical protein
MTLAESAPREFTSGEYSDTSAYRYRDVKVVFTHDDEHWPGTHKNVHRWWLLANGKKVGWNENPARGWSFPVI